MTDVDGKPQTADSYEALLERSRPEQNFPLAVLAGSVAAALCAVVWAWVTVYTKSKLGILSFALGLVTGQAVRITGKGIDKKFGVLAGVCSLLGTLVGDVFIEAMLRARPGEALEYLAPENLPRAFDAYINNLQPMDFLFYAFAIYFGYRNAFRFGPPRPPESLLKTAAQSINLHKI